MGEYASAPPFLLSLRINAGNRVSLKRIALLLTWLALFPFVLSAADAPVTTAANVTNAVPGVSTVVIPVTVTGFTSIGHFTLTLNFDTTRVKYLSVTTNPSLTGMSVSYTNPISSQGKLIFTWTGSSGTNVSLADGSALAEITFSYVTGTGILAWGYNLGSVCVYKRYVNGVLTSLNDSPQYLFYLNGGISNRGAPMTTAPAKTVTAMGSFTVPVTVNAFTSIKSLTLKLEYDPAVITYQSYTKNAAFGSSFLVASQPGSGGKYVVVIQWYGSNPVTLANGSTLCTLTFNYISATYAATALTWFDDGPSCQYADGTGDVLIDLPANTYYVNGSVSPPVVSVSVVPSANPSCEGSLVTFTATPVNGGTAPSYQWKVNGNNAGTDNPLFSCLPVNSVAVTCILTSSLTFATGNPATSNAVVMTVIPLIQADFVADKLTPEKNETVMLTSLPTGDAALWNWNFDRPDVIFVDGTNSSSENPKVMFTDGGLFTVTLTASNGCFSDTMVKNGYIRAGIPGLWSGVASDDWSDPSNWDNVLVPDSQTDVRIPGSSAVWPVFTGNFTVGINCRKLTIEGPSGRMTVTGNLVINQE